MATIDAVAARPLHELLSRRRSTRAFAPRPVGCDQLKSVLEAARWAPSSFNEQPWSFIVARREDTGAFADVLSTLMAPNPAWAAAAPVLIVAVAQTTRPNGAPSRHALYDLGLAVQSLVLQATALGLATRQMGGFDVAKAREVLDIPEGHEPVVVIALGEPGEAAALPEGLRAAERAPRARRALESIVHHGRWGGSLDALDESEGT